MPKSGARVKAAVTRYVALQVDEPLDRRVLRDGGVADEAGAGERRRAGDDDGDQIALHDGPPPVHANAIVLTGVRAAPAPPRRRAPPPPRSQGTAVGRAGARPADCVHRSRLASQLDADCAGTIGSSRSAIVISS